MQETTAPELLLITDLTLSPNPLEEIVAAANAAPIISVLLTNSEKSPSKELIAKIQAHNIAVLLEDNYESVKTLNADGVHLTQANTETFETVRSKLGDDFIVGTSANSSRHIAMHNAEKGASYIAINTANTHSENSDEAENKHENQQPPTIEWWEALFETPGIAWNIETKQQAIKAQQAGAHYIALSPKFWQQGAATTTIMTELQNALIQKQT